MRAASGVVAGSYKNETMGRILNLRLSEVLWFLLINGLLFQSFLTKYIAAAGFLDEAVTILLSVCAISSYVGYRENKTTVLSYMERAGLGMLMLVAFLGFLSGYISQVQPNIMPISIDFFACAKFPVALISGFIVFRDNAEIFPLLLREVKGVLILMLPFALINQFVDIGMRYDVRYGLYSFQFLFGHPASLAAVVVGFLVLLLAEAKKNTIWQFLCWLFLISSLRSTAIAFAAFSFLVWLFSRKRGRVGVGQILAFTSVVIYFGWSQIQYYFFELDGSARRKLLDVGIEIANRFFPLGSGFATYGSNVTGLREYYSSLYSQYGLSGVFGLTVENSSFLSDSFWPILFGQFGWVGTVLYCAALVFLMLGSIGRLREGGLSTLPLVFTYSYLVLTSFSSSAFFHPMALYLAFCAVLAACYQFSHLAK